ncbi:MAG: SMI1/KNR4 family protein [Sandaracinus sp.]|nr:SMI1/KNR4 family protein [Sandaracinus sp.]MCB9621809.1 SMI1/KNR4 family protein [Sandaracinus sp.]
MDVESLVTSWQKRLVAMEDDRPFRFVDTTRSEAERYLASRRTFRGFSEAEIAEAEARLQGTFPHVFRTYLLRMGQSPGALFTGSDLAALGELHEFRQSAIELFREVGVTCELPSHAAVFLFHQGYSLAYVVADGSADGPVYTYADDQDAPHVGATSFADFVEAELAACEEAHRGLRATGGYYLRVDRSGGAMHFPALASGERALDRPDCFDSE